MIIHSTFADLLLFIYVHMSESDNNYDPYEMAVIKEKMTKLFPTGTDLEKKLYHAIREYNAFDKSKLNDLFEDSFAHFSKKGLTVSSDVIKDVQEIFSADGGMNTDEANAMEALKKVIDQHVKS